MWKICGPIAPIAVVAAVLALGAGVSLHAKGARAGDCLATPNASSPSGQHWYYRRDRSTGRKCWFLHPFLRPFHRAAARPKSHEVPAASAHAKLAIQAPTAQAPVPAPAASASTPASASNTDRVSGSPHVEILAVKTIGMPFVGATSQEDLNQNAVTQRDIPADTPAVAQASAREASKKQVSGVQPTDAEADPAPSNAALSVERGKPTVGAIGAGVEGALKKMRPAEMFFLLMFGLGMTAYLTSAVIKVVAMHRKLARVDQPDNAWTSYRLRSGLTELQASHEGQDDRSLNPQERQKLAKRREQNRIIAGALLPASVSVAQSQEAGSTSAEPSRPNYKDLEPALRVLWEARRHRAA